MWAHNPAWSSAEPRISETLKIFMSAVSAPL